MHPVKLTPLGIVTVLGCVVAGFHGVLIVRLVIGRVWRKGYDHERDRARY